MAPVCASPMLTPGYTAGGYWEDGFLLCVVANGEWMGEKEGFPGYRNEITGLYRVQFCLKKSRPEKAGLTECNILQMRWMQMGWIANIA